MVACISNVSWACDYSICICIFLSKIFKVHEYVSLGHAIIDKSIAMVKCDMPDLWGCLDFEWVMRREDVSDRTVGRRVPMGRCLYLVGLRTSIKIFGPPGSDVYGALEIITVVNGVEEGISRSMVWQVTDIDDK